MPEPTVLSDLSNQLADAVERAAKSIVTVHGRARQSASGVVYAKGLVLTANHVLERDEDLTVDHNGTTLAVTIAGRDPASDLAVLRAPSLDLEAATASDGPARVGQLALAVGRPSSQSPSASLGIVSLVGGPLRTGRGLSLEQYIRTDATPYPGFSGGPLIDATGAVLGITTTGFGQVALAVPHVIAWRIAQGLAEKGTPRRGYIGVSSQPVRLPESIKSQTPHESGLLVLRVEDNSPSAKAGIMLGDVIVTLDGHAAGDTDDLLALLSGERVGKTVAIEVIRGGALQKMEITIGERS
ncbi:MAG TPA: S1C family serine protease [Chloroflexota bacterium]|nr:S1C family serine protease [Chloroflexota bacterium]